MIVILTMEKVWITCLSLLPTDTKGYVELFAMFFLMFYACKEQFNWFYVRFNLHNILVIGQYKDDVYLLWL